MAKTKSPTQRTLEECRKRGWIAGVTERWNPHALIRQDLFGFVDVLAAHESNGIVAIQATTAGNWIARHKKICANPNARRWIAAGGSIEIWAWAKRKLKRGGKAFRWTLEERPVAIEEITNDLSPGSDSLGE